jgi:hypothetical protein
MTTGEAIRNFCKECVNSVQTKVIKDCGGEYVRATKKPCALFKLRLKGKGNLKLIRRNCVECMGGSFESVSECQTADCFLHPFRFGKLPAFAGRKNLQGNLKGMVKV